MKFSEINIEDIRNKGFDKLLIMKEGKLLVGGSIKNVLLHKAILDNKNVVAQMGDQDIWIVEIED